MKILIEGWFNIPHSYAIVNNFQLIHLIKNYSDVEIYIKEEPYYREEWNNKKQLVFPEDYNKIIKNFKIWKGEKVDLIYRITYPYNIEANDMMSTPKCIYFTAEFKQIDSQYFQTDKLIKGVKLDDNYIDQYIRSHPKLYFTSPSEWSENALDKYGICKGSRHRIIPNGVDIKIFNNNKSNRLSIRNFYGVEENDIIFLNIGAMTKNKGIIEILVCINALVNKLKMKNVKLMLKGTEDLYSSKTFLLNYLKALRENGYITESEIDNLIKNHIIFIQQTLTYSRMNDIYNACDIYFTPYNAEGFNLPALEAIATDMKVIITEGGSTDFFVKDILNNVKHIKNNIFLVPSKLKPIGDGKEMLEINCNELVQICLKSIETLKIQGSTSYGYRQLIEFIDEKYSWNAISKDLYNYFQEIIRNN